jgi:hypothetical protein
MRKFYRLVRIMFEDQLGLFVWLGTRFGGMLRVVLNLKDVFGLCLGEVIGRLDLLAELLKIYELVVDGLAFLK